MLRRKPNDPLAVPGQNGAREDEKAVRALAGDPRECALVISIANPDHEERDTEPRGGLLCLSQLRLKSFPLGGEDCDSCSLRDHFLEEFQALIGEAGCPGPRAREGFSQ